MEPSVRVRFNVIITCDNTICQKWISIPAIKAQRSVVFILDGSSEPKATS